MQCKLFIISQDTHVTQHVMPDVTLMFIPIFHAVWTARWDYFILTQAAYTHHSLTGFGQEGGKGEMSRQFYHTTSENIHVPLAQISSTRYISHSTFHMHQQYSTNFEMTVHTLLCICYRTLECKATKYYRHIGQLYCQSTIGSLDLSPFFQYSVNSLKDMFTPSSSTIF